MFYLKFPQIKLNYLKIELLVISNAVKHKNFRFYLFVNMMSSLNPNILKQNFV
jgi:hypothetical protein